MSKEKLTHEGIDEAVRLTGLGLNDADIAAYLGVAPETLSRWKNHPRTENQRRLCQALKKAEVERKSTLLRRIIQASDTTWQAAAWMLERRYPAEYAKPTRPADGGEAIKTDEQVKGLIDALGLR